MDDTNIRANATKAINEDVTWYPAWASNRIGAMVEQRPDWCISRQRNWGVHDRRTWGRRRPRPGSSREHR